ncbi:hypothetical protein EEL39_13505 [Muribaculaceae bacterium Isolate-080 (Janvier)]|jgi:hypothetical protein|nr:hypothetical protein EEL39_13505 [Muribaculaceae bacterium Isolate-080 (Janvier)]
MDVSTENVFFGIAFLLSVAFNYLLWSGGCNDTADDFSGHGKDIKHENSKKTVRKYKQRKRKCRKIQKHQNTDKS